MSLEYIGLRSFSGPTKSAGASPINAPPICDLLMQAIGKVAIEIAAAFTGSAELHAKLTITPPTLALILESLVEFEAQLSLAGDLGLPSVSFDVSAVLSQIAELNASFALSVALEAMLRTDAAIWGTGVIGPGVTLGTQLGVEYAGFWPQVGAVPIPSTLDASMFIFGAVDLPEAPPIDIPPFLTQGQIVPGVIPSDVASSKMMQLFNGVPYGDSPAATATFNNIGEMTSVTLDAMAQADAAIQYRLDAMLQVAANIQVTPPSFSLSLEAIAKFKAFLVANASAALPKVDFALGFSAEFTASLAARFDAIIKLGLALNAPFATVYVYKYTGGLTALTAPVGPDSITAALGAPAFKWGDQGSFDLSSLFTGKTLVVGSTDPLAFAKLEAFFSGAV